jgi:hypothetical protein
VVVFPGAIESASRKLTTQPLLAGTITHRIALATPQAVVALNEFGRGDSRRLEKRGGPRLPFLEMKFRDYPIESKVLLEQIARRLESTQLLESESTPEARAQEPR